MKIVVVGSLNMDLVVRMPQIPRPGETLLGGIFKTFPGGKGANQAVAAARVITSPPVPVAVVADPVTAQVLDGSSGRLIGEGFGAIPVRDRLQEILAASGAEPLSPSRREKEKRILLAFDAIKCCVPQGADGGVRIGGSCDGEVSQD